MTTTDGGTTAAPTPEDPAIGDLIRAFTRLRRLMVKPAASLLPLPSTGRRVDLAKLMACQAVAEAVAGVPGSAGGAPPTVKDVALALELEHSTASRLLGEAEGEGLVVRSTDPADRRRTTVELTDLGRTVVRESTAIQVRVLGAALADWESDEIRTLAGLVQRFAGSLHKELPDILRQCHTEIGRRAAAPVS